MSCARKMILAVCLSYIMLLMGCAHCPQIPSEALAPLPVIERPKAPALHTVPLIDESTGKPAGLLFPGDDAYKEQEYRIALEEASDLGAANTRAANRIFEILRTPPKQWWQFWK